MCCVCVIAVDIPSFACLCAQASSEAARQTEKKQPIPRQGMDKGVCLTHLSIQATPTTTRRTNQRTDRPRPNKQTNKTLASTLTRAVGRRHLPLLHLHGLGPAAPARARHGPLRELALQRGQLVQRLLW